MRLPRNVAGRFEYGPSQYALRKSITNGFEEVVRSYGYDLIETSALERHEYLTAAWGGGMEDDIFVVPPQDGQALALRFDATLPCIRMYLDHVEDLPSPRRWAMVSECFRRDPLDDDRRWSFLQLNAECFGYCGAQVDAEIIEIMAATLARAGVTDGEFTLHLNDRRIVADLAAQVGSTGPELLRVLDRHDADSPPVLYDALVAEAGLAPRDARWLVDVLALGDEPDALDRVADHLRSVDARRGVEHIAALLDLGPAPNLRLDLRVMRGLEYYSSLVFECFPTRQRRSALGAGGRYDALVERLGGPPTAAAGFAIGVVPLLGLLRNGGRTCVTPDPVNCVVACATITPDAMARCQAILRGLRSRGYRCVLIPLAQTIDSLRDAATGHGAQWALLVPAPSECSSLYRTDVVQNYTQRIPWTDVFLESNDVER
jgi:histidyl-tRNA synthetase